MVRRVLLAGLVMLGVASCGVAGGDGEDTSAAARPVSTTVVGTTSTASTSTTAATTTSTTLAEPESTTSQASIGTEGAAAPDDGADRNLMEELTSEQFGILTAVAVLAGSMGIELSDPDMICMVDSGVLDGGTEDESVARSYAALTSCLPERLSTAMVDGLGPSIGEELSCFFGALVLEVSKLSSEAQIEFWSTQDGDMATSPTHRQAALTCGIDPANLESMMLAAQAAG